ncbi:hypothetical protein NKOR_06100 [Candidatus Nitrosopumilus koreensis AR1]|uniref:Uncharacterized protein n=1 Tax=Candidatus Nitrosopumilus koreensis AR1 TaxID=1229908 RepID=K0B4K5_9ARCH|nr:MULTISPECIES: hypothetical protein [Nitrosopumilus]AFS81103.1 hypothetical protein NKOR_06100 [Candidatus Nitrosopumilus koreensis AR1]
MNTNNICLTIAVIAIAGILTGTTPIANAWLYNIYSDKPLEVTTDTMPFIKEYVDNLEEYVEEHDMESVVSNDFIV